jgi:hypothetical protein
MMHFEVQQMLDRTDRVDNLLATIRARPPRLIVWDDWLAAVDPKLTDYLHANYTQTQHELLWLRRDGVPVAKVRE